MSQIKVGTTKLMIFHRGGLRYARSYRWNGSLWLFVSERRI